MLARGGAGILVIATLLGAPACADSADTVAASERLPQAVEPVAEAAKEVRVSSKILDVRVPARLPDGFALANAGLGSRITLKYAGAQAAQAEPVGGGFHYRDALGPGFDVTVARSRSGIEDTVELPSAPPGGAIRYEIERVAGIAGFRTAHGTVELLDSFGTPAMRVGRATVIDAAGASHPIALTLRGCAAEDGGLPPWGRPVTEPGADRCVIEARMPEGLRYPARLDPTWEVTTSMNEYRYDVPAVLLPNGRVFVVGGRGEGAEVNAEVYDPDSETWTYVPSADLTTPAYDFTLTALQGGRLLLTGGEWDLPSSTIVANVRALNATTFVWSVVQSMAVPRSDHRATLLDDGRLLVSGGRDSNSASLASAEIFDPIANTWSTTGSLIEGRFLHEAVLHNGRVLVAGGLPPSNSSTNTSEIFDPTADGGVGAWVFPRIFFGSRYSHAMALLGDDRAIIFGGNVGSLTTASVQVYDFASNVWSSAPDLPLPGGVPGLMYGRAARALDGGVIFTGGCDGYQYCDGPSNLATYYDPVTAAPTPSGTIGTPRGRHAMVVLADGSILVVGGEGSGFYFNDALVLRGLANGEECDTAYQCASDQCVDGVCCETACDGICEACLESVTEVADGVCAPIVPNTDPQGDCADDGAPNCGQNGLCGENGECAHYDGPGCTPFACLEDEECDSGHCVDGICCDTACDELCYACTAARKGTGGNGTCGPIVAGLDPDDDCADGAADTCEALRLCDGFGACSNAEELCAPFACNDEGCLATCSSPIDCADGFVCIGEACIGEDELCKNESILLQADGSTLDCAPYRCTPTECKTSCAAVEDCSTPYVCDGATETCILPPPGTGGDAGCALGGEPKTYGWVLAALGAFLIERRRRR